jgi:predicted AAA+ superfamily ATPase
MDEGEIVEFNKIVKRYRITPLFMRYIMKYRALGCNNTTIAERLGISKNTVNKYVSLLRNLPDEEKEIVYKSFIEKEMVEK